MNWTAIRIFITLCVISVFFILSSRAHCRHQDCLFGNHNRNDQPDRSKLKTIDKVCPRQNITHPAWVTNRDDCSLNCNPDASYQGNPGGSTSSVFFLLPIIWTIGTRKSDRNNWLTREAAFDIVLSFHFTCLAVGSLLFHATRTRFYWQFDIAFTILSPWALFIMEVLDWIDRNNKNYCYIAFSLLLYFGVVIPIAFVWRWRDTFSVDYTSTFQIVVGVSTGICFLAMLCLRIKLYTFLKLLGQNSLVDTWNEQSWNTKKNYIAVIVSVILGVFGAILLDANLKKENENNTSAFYFCNLWGFWSSLSVGHIILSLSVTALCVTYRYPIEEIFKKTSSVKSYTKVKIGLLYF